LSGPLPVGRSIAPEGAGPWLISPAETTEDAREFLADCIGLVGRDAVAGEDVGSAGFRLPSRASGAGSPPLDTGLRPGSPGARRPLDSTASTSEREAAG